MPIYEIDALIPSLADSGYVADAATVIGNATLCEDVSVWSSAVIRADYASIFIGAGTNIQEGAVLHADPDFPLKVGKKVTIGHQAILHGCTIEDGALIGIQAVVLNGAVIGKNCLVGAGALVTEGKVFPDNSLILGSPAKVVREVSEDQLRIMQRDTWDYVLRGRRYKKTQKRIG